MEFNRNQYLMVGLIVLAIGAQLRLVDTYVLNDESVCFIQERISKKPAITNSRLSFQVMSTAMPLATKSVKPPKWVGWFVLSVGIVLSLHSLAMPKP